MAVPTARPRPRANPRILTASAMKAEPRDQDVVRRRSQPWQKSALEYAKIIPELNYASRFYSKMLSRIEIYPATRDELGSLTPINEGPPVDLLDRIQDPGGGRSTLLSQYGRLMFITGEGYLFGRNLTTDEERWSFVAMDELEMGDDGTIKHKFQNGPAPIEYKPAQAEAYRFWTPSPEKSGEAESPIRSVEMIAEELIILTKSVRATAVSRMIQGMLKVPSELSFGAEEAGTDDDPEQNTFLADLIDHILGIVENAGTAEAASPFLAEGALEYLAGLEWMKMHDPQTDYMEQGLRKEAIERMAHGLDFPAEYLLSFSDANHWVARAITHEMWRTHGAPLAEQFCDDLSEAYLRPALRDTKYEDWKSVVVAYDDAKVVVPVDTSEDADRAADRGMISFKGYRQKKSIDEDLAPNDLETRIYLALKLRNPAFLKGTKYEIDEPTPSAQPPGPQPSKDEPRPAEDGPPNPGPAGVSREESRAAALHGAAYAALHRCREIAGARIRQSVRSQSRQAPELEKLNGCKNTQAAAVLGQENLTARGLDPPGELVKGGAEAFVSICTEWGIDDTQAKALGQTIEVFASRTLFEPGLPAFPSGFFAQIARANEISHELGEEAIVARNNAAMERLQQMLPIHSRAALAKSS